MKNLKIFYNSHLYYLKKINLKFKNKFFSNIFVNHRNTVDNNPLAPFDFTEENYSKVIEILVRLKL